MYRTRDHLEDYTDRCIGCGSCRKVCPSYRHGGCDPLSVMKGDASTVTDCIGCGNCSKVCTHTEPKIVMMATLNKIRNMKVPDVFFKTGYVMNASDCQSRTELVPKWNGDDAYVMPGCIIKCSAPYVEYAMSVVTESLGMKCRELPNFTCCMYPVPFYSMDDDERNGYRTRMGDTANGKDIITLCAGCSETLGTAGVRAEHVIDLLHRNLDRLPKMKRKLKVSLEPGCAAIDKLDLMREVVIALGCEPIGNVPGCCGKTSKKAAGPLMEERQKAAADADVIVVGCPMCFVRYDSFPKGRPVLHIAELAAMAFGDGSSLKYHRNHDF